MLGKSKIRFWITVDRRVDTILRREAMKKGISLATYVRHIMNEHIIKEGHNINDLLNQVP
jgi:hypothetical protein